MEDEESQNTIEELAKAVSEQLDTGIPRHEIIKGLSDAGLERSEAEQFVASIESLQDEALNEARKQAGTKDLGCGFLLLIVGVAITLGTWSATEAGGSYWVMWGAMVFGAFYILRGLYRKITTVTDAGARMMWILGSIILIGGMVGGGVAITNMMNPPELTPPDDSFIVSEERSFWEDEIAGIARITGTISNAHGEWSITGVKILVEALDEADNVIETYEVSVIPSTIPPGEKGVYSNQIQVPYSCVTVAPAVEWEWVTP